MCGEEREVRKDAYEKEYDTRSMGEQRTADENTRKRTGWKINRSDTLDAGQ